MFSLRKWGQPKVSRKILKLWQVIIIFCFWVTKSSFVKYQKGRNIGQHYAGKIMLMTHIPFALFSAAVCFSIITAINHPKPCINEHVFPIWLKWQAVFSSHPRSADFKGNMPCLNPTEADGVTPVLNRISCLKYLDYSVSLFPKHKSPPVQFSCCHLLSWYKSFTMASKATNYWTNIACQTFSNNQ